MRARSIELYRMWGFDSEKLPFTDPDKFKDEGPITVYGQDFHLMRKKDDSEL